jgi:hypothetical protein
MAMQLDPADIEAVAERVAELLEHQAVESRQPGELVDAAAVGRLLGVSRATVYAKADELGAVRLGDGKKPRLRFDPSRLPAQGSPKQSATDDPLRRGRRRPRKSSHDGRIELLPIRGPAPVGANRRRPSPQQRG